MIIFNIAEWIANFFLLGISIIVWAVGAFMIMMILSLVNQWLREAIKGTSNE